MAVENFQQHIDGSTYFGHLATRLAGVEQELRRHDLKDIAKLLDETRGELLYLQQYYRIAYNRYDEYQAY